MHRFLPGAIKDWHPSATPVQYSGTEIYQYMDGAGEVYLAYRFKSMIVQRYAVGDQEEILVEIFDMQNPRNAFGVSTYMRGRGSAVPIGQDGEYRSGLLTFWRGRYYVCVRIENENSEAKEAVLDAGRQIAGTIGKDGRRPSLIDYLPRNSIDTATLRYFFRDEILNTHVTLPDVGLLGPGGDAEGVLARLTRDRSYVILIRYPDPRRADSAYQRLVSGKGPAWEEKGKWSATIRSGRHVLVATNALSQESAGKILKQLRRRLP